MITCTYKLCYANASDELEHLLHRTDHAMIDTADISVGLGALSETAVATFFNVLGHLPEIRDVVLTSCFPLEDCCCLHWRPFYSVNPEPYGSLKPCAITSWSIVAKLLYHRAPHLEVLDIDLADSIDQQGFNEFTTALVANTELHEVSFSEKVGLFPIHFNGFVDCLYQLPYLQIVDLPTVMENANNPGRNNSLMLLLNKPTVREFCLRYSFSNQQVIDILEEMLTNTNLTKLILPGLILEEQSRYNGSIYNDAINNVIRYNQFLEELHFVGLSTVYLAYCIPSTFALLQNHRLKSLTYQAHHLVDRCPPTHMSPNEVHALTEVILHHNDVLESLLFNDNCPCPKMEFYLKLNACQLPCLVSSRSPELTETQCKSALIENSGDPQIIFYLLLYNPSILNNC